MEENKKEKSFKKTKLGEIPEDWNVKRIKDFAKVVTGTTPPTKEASYYGNDYFFVSPADLGYSKYIRNSGKKLSVKGYEVSRKMPANSVLFTCIGSTIGKLGISERALTSNQQINAVLPSENHDSSYLYYELNRLAPKIRLLAGEQAVPMINKTEFELNYVILPPKPEQQEIAEILSNWDEAIEKTQQLIEQLEMRKKGLIQELLTGQKRLPGFDGEWKKYEIDEIAKQFTDKNSDNKISVVLSCTKYDGLVRSLEYFGRKVYGDDLTKYKVVPKNYFAYATNHIEEGSLGYQNLIEAGLVSPMYTVFKTNDKVDDSYLFWLLKTERMIYHYQSSMSGSVARRGGLRWSAFKELIITLPPIDEQKAIASFLSEADNEIGLQRKKLESLRSQKKGLMQELLTGKKRVNTDE